MAWLEDLQPTPASKWVAGSTLAGSIGLLFVNEPIAKLGIVVPVLENPWIRSLASLALFSIGMLVLNILLLLQLRGKSNKVTGSDIEYEVSGDSNVKGLTKRMFNRLDPNQQEILKYLSRHGSVLESQLQEQLGLELQQLNRQLNELYSLDLADDFGGVCHIWIVLTKRGTALMRMVEPDREPTQVYAR